MVWTPPKREYLFTKKESTKPIHTYKFPPLSPDPQLLKKLPVDPKVFARIREDTNTVLLAFSCGKDAICSWVVLRAAGFNVVPLYRYCVPGLKFVEKSLKYYEDFFGQHIFRITDPELYNAICRYQHQPHYMRRLIDNLALPSFKNEDTNREVCKTVGLPTDTWTAVGLKKSDSFRRRRNLSVMILPGVNSNSRAFYPIMEFTKNDLISALKEVEVKLPRDYLVFGRSFEDPGYRFISIMKDAYPNDYQTMLRWFPDLDEELIRVEIARKHGQIY